MKRKHILKRTPALCAIVILAAGASVSLHSCTHEDIGGSMNGDDGSLRFVVSEKQAWTVGTRASQPASTTGKTVKMEGSSGEPIYLHVSSTPVIDVTDPVTKGSISGEEKQHNNFGLYAYAYSGGFQADQCQFNYWYNLPFTRKSEGSNIYVPATKDSSGDYTASGIDLFLPGNENLMLFALMPPDPYLSSQTDMKPVENTSGMPVFNFKAPAYSVNQHDICLIRGTEVKAGASGNVNLDFSHVLTRIRIVADASMEHGYVKHMSFTGVRGKGTFTPNLDTDTDTGAGTWTYADDDDLNIVYYAYNHDNGTNQMNIEVGTGSDVDLTTDEDGTIYYMMPQELGDPAMLEIHFLPEGSDEEEVLTAALTDYTWEMGHTVTYRISHQESNDQVLEIYEGDGTTRAEGKTYTMDFQPSDPRKYFQVKSLRGDDPVEYSIQFSTDNGMSWVDNTAETRPALILNTTKNSGSSGTWEQYITIRSGNYTVNGEDAKTLQAAGWRTDVGLIGGDGKPNESANCYIVTSAGTYRFLAVYGNAFKNDAPNTDVVNKEEYRDGLNRKITEPYITTQYPNFTVKLIWQDVDGLITDVGKTGSGSEARITFTVGGSASTYRNIMQPGNALIGAYTQNNELIWSWHIWVTPEVPGITVSGKQTATFLKYPIGFVRGGQMPAVAESSVQVRAVAQAENGDLIYTEPFTITRRGASAVNRYGRYPTFQWGRKEPMWPSSPSYSGMGAPLYNSDGGAVTFNISNLTPPEGFIRNPTTFDRAAGGLDGNLWNASGAGTVSAGSIQTGNNVTKSIYDPSPAGYRVAGQTQFEALLNNNFDFTHTITDMVHADGTMANTDHYVSIANVFLPLSGARTPPNFTALNYGNLPFGGSWTAARVNFDDRVVSEVCVYSYGGNTLFNFFPHIVTMTSDTFTYTAWSQPIYCWPVIPVQDN